MAELSRPAAQSGRRRAAPGRPVRPARPHRDGATAASSPSSASSSAITSIARTRSASRPWRRRSTSNAAPQPDPAAAQRVEWAGLLHEIGYTVSHIGYHRHSAYILENADMPGFSAQEQRQLAVLVHGCRGGLSKMEPVLRDAQMIAQVLALRLAVLFHHARRAIDTPRIALEAGRTIRFDVPARWLKRHPLTLHLLVKANARNGPRSASAGGRHRPVGPPTLEGGPQCTRRDGKSDRSNFASTLGHAVDGTATSERHDRNKAMTCLRFLSSHSKLCWSHWRHATFTCAPPGIHGRVASSRHHSGIARFINGMPVQLAIRDETRPERRRMRERRAGGHSMTSACYATPAIGPPFESVPDQDKRDPSHDPWRFRTIWISDTHLGTPGCQAAALLNFLRATECGPAVPRRRHHRRLAAEAPLVLAPGAQRRRAEGAAQGAQGHRA